MDVNNNVDFNNNNLDAINNNVDFNNNGGSNNNNPNNNNNVNNGNTYNNNHIGDMLHRPGPSNQSLPTPRSNPNANPGRAEANLAPNANPGRAEANLAPNANPGRAEANLAPNVNPGRAEANPAPNAPALVCPAAPTKSRQRRPARVMESLQDEPRCARNLGFPVHGVSCGRVTRPLAPRKKVPQDRPSLRLNRGVLPRPFQPRVRRDILQQALYGRNIVRIMGVEDPAENWIDLNDIHRNPINRAGNPQAPRAPRKDRTKMADSFHAQARRMRPRRLQFFEDSEDESSSSDEDSEDSGYGGRPWDLIFNF